MCRKLKKYIYYINPQYRSVKSVLLCDYMIFFSMFAITVHFKNGSLPKSERNHTTHL